MEIWVVGLRFQFPTVWLRNSTMYLSWNHEARPPRCDMLQDGVNGHSTLQYKLRNSPGFSEDWYQEWWEGRKATFINSAVYAMDWPPVSITQEYVGWVIILRCTASFSFKESFGIGCSIIMMLIWMFMILLVWDTGTSWLKFSKPGLER